MATAAADPANSQSTAGQSNVPVQPGGSQTPQANSSASQLKPGDISQADRVRFVERVEQAFHSAGDSGGTVRLRLSPPELGSMRLQITVRNGAMTARAETETPAARNLLLDNLPLLRERLAQHDVKVQHFDVNLMDQSSGDASGQTSSSLNYYQGPSSNKPSAPADVESGGGNAAGDAGIVRRAGQGYQLNVIV